MQALPVVKGLVEFDLFGFGDFAQVRHIDMAQAAPLVSDPTKHRVIRMTSVTSLVMRNLAILKMRGSEIPLIVHVETPAVVRHDMTGKAELSAMGAFHLPGKAHQKGQRWEEEERDEGQYLAAASPGKIRPERDQGSQDNRDDDERQNFHFAFQASASIHPKPSLGPSYYTCWIERCGPLKVPILTKSWRHIVEERLAGELKDTSALRRTGLIR
jgi:hypothetical protein